jgi:hypothetical protein
MVAAGIVYPETTGEKTSMFFRRLSAFSRKQSFEVDILSSSKMAHISGQTIPAATIACAQNTLGRDGVVWTSP